LLNFLPGSTCLRVLLIVRKAAVKFVPLGFGKADILRVRGDGVPNILYQLDSLGDTQLNKFGQ